jgi:ElaB/YqjD/DUF883 family membrane-anchored ribosome-binding protein
MATTSDLAPTRGRKSGSNTAGASNAEGMRSRASREQNLEEQVARLQEDIKSIAATLARMGGEKVSDARDTAESEYRHLLRQGREVVGEVSSQAGALERQLVETVREKPLTAIAGAIGIGFILALMSRR